MPCGRDESEQHALAGAEPGREALGAGRLHPHNQSRDTAGESQIEVIDKLARKEGMTLLAYRVVFGSWEG